jgi:AcrR family transcriptional regulator
MAATPATPDAPRPLRRDAERNRQRILAAAQELFAERGAHVTLDDVAERAEVGVGTVYRRFADRNALIDALFTARVDQLAEAAEQASALDDAWAGLVYLFERQIAFQLEDRAFAEVLFREEAGDEPLARARERIAPHVIALIERAKAQGAVRPDVEVGDFPVLNLMFMTMVNATRDVAPDAWRRYLNIVLAGLQPSASLPLPVAAPSIDRVDEIMRSGLRAGSSRTDR